MSQIGEIKSGKSHGPGFESHRGVGSAGGNAATLGGAGAKVSVNLDFQKKYSDCRIASADKGGQSRRVVVSENKV